VSIYEARAIVDDGLRDEEAFAVLGAANRVCTTSKMRKPDTMDIC
jgi:hypothetical protein